MPTKKILSDNRYDLLENDNGEFMLLINAMRAKPQNPSFSLNKKEKTLELKRGTQVVILKDLKSTTFKNLNNLKEIYVCEIDEKEKEVVYAYTADLASA